MILRDEIINNTFAYAHRYYPYYHWEIIYEELKKDSFLIKVYASFAPVKTQDKLLIVNANSAIQASCFITYNVPINSKTIKQNEDTLRKAVKDTAKELSKKIRRVKNEKV